MSTENALAEAQPATETPTVDEGSAAPAETEQATRSEQQTETTESRPSRARERIQELAADKRAAIEFAELQRRRADELEARLNAQPKPSVPSGAPKLADFKTPEEWAAATQAWSIAEAHKTVDQKLSEREQQAGEAERQRSFDSSMREAATSRPDYWDVVTDPSATWLNPVVVDVLKDFSNAGELAYYLASHPSEGREIAALSPRRIAAALGRLETSMSKPSPKPKVTGAPPPPDPVSGGSAVATDYAKLAKQDTAAYIKARRAQRRAEGKR